MGHPRDRPAARASPSRRVRHRRADPPQGARAARASGTAIRCSGSSATSTSATPSRSIDRYLDADAARRSSSTAPTSSCCPTTRATRPRPACSSRLWRRASRSSRPASRTRSSCSADGAGPHRAAQDPRVDGRRDPTRSPRPRARRRACTKRRSRDAHDPSWPRSPSSTARSPIARSRSPRDARRVTTRPPGTVLLASRRAVGRARRLRACPVRCPAPRSRLLRRRRGSGARRRCCANPTDARAARLAETCLRSSRTPSTADGRVHNRMAAGGGWTDDPALGDWWGRALRALGAAAAQRADGARTRSRALTAFHRAASVRSPHGRAMAFATLGAADVLDREPRRPRRARSAARRGLVDRDPADDRWPWPEPRLRYANAVAPRSAAGRRARRRTTRASWPRARDAALPRGCRDGRRHLSVTGTGGRGPAQRSAQFDQQPIEVAAIADACARAFDITDETRWRDGVASPGRGSRVATTRPAMFDPDSGAGFDGLKRTDATRTAERSRRSRR